ncbi:unnamed protein product [Auanema sp. JU1783]|nr:unnamed protein product [Auanema sp. JU1783]
MSSDDTPRSSFSFMTCSLPTKGGTFNVDNLLSRLANLPPTSTSIISLEPRPTAKSSSSARRKRKQKDPDMISSSSIQSFEQEEPPSIKVENGLASTSPQSMNITSPTTSSESFTQKLNSFRETEHPTVVSPSVGESQNIHDLLLHSLIADNGNLPWYLKSQEAIQQLFSKVRYASHCAIHISMHKLCSSLLSYLSGLTKHR